jgi:hypothetical protein
LFYLIKPLLENPAAGPLQSFAKAGRILAERARINFRFTKFHRVANQPGFDAVRLRFDVKLDSEQVRPFPERLGWAMNCACKILASRRWFEDITVPMKNMNPFEVPQGARSPGRRQLDGGPSNFLRWPRRNFGSKCFRHKLCAKTYTKRWAQESEATRNQCHFAAEKGISIFFVDADWPAEHDENVTVFDLCALEPIHTNLKISRFEPAMLKN